MWLRTVISVVLSWVGCGYHPHTALTKAAFEGNAAEVQQILDSGYRDAGDIQEALVVAARVGNAGAIPVLVKNGAALAHRSGVNNWTPLQHAIHKNRKASVHALLDAGADPNTGLSMAAGYGQAQIVAALLAAGADPSRVYSGRNAVDVALTGVRDIDAWTAGNCQTETIRELLRSNPRLRPLQAPIPAACPEIARLFAARSRLAPR